jgi:hypothetical protein
MSIDISMKRGREKSDYDRVEHQAKSIDHPMCVHIKQPKAILCFSSHVLFYDDNVLIFVNEKM